jgi:hypothetical protein
MLGRWLSLPARSPGRARRVGDQLGRPVVSVANGREITITFASVADIAG